MANEEAQRLNDHELFLQSIDQSNYPYISMRGMLVWNGSAWEKWDGVITGGDASAANQVTEIAHLATIAGDTTSLDGKNFATQTTLAAINTKLVTGTVIGDVNLGATDNAVLDSIAAKDFSTSAKQDTLLTELQLKADLTETQPVKEIRSATGTRTQIADNAADVELLASNANRLGATFFNDSSASLYLGLGTTVTSATNYTVKLVSCAYYEVPFGFTGQVKGIWASDPGDGACRVTELT